MMKTEGIAQLLAIMLAFACTGTPPGLIPRSAVRLGPNVYKNTLVAGAGPAATCGELYGYDAHSIGMFTRSNSDTDSKMLRRDQLVPEWRTLLLSMREGERAFAWIRIPGGRGRFQKYEVFLARVDRLDSDGGVMVESHDSLCR